MADVFLHVTHPGIVREGEAWPPKPNEPIRSDRETFFPPTGEPTSNSQAVTIMHNEAPPEPLTAPISTAEATFAVTGQPISNEQGAATLYAPQQQQLPSRESSLIGGPSNTEVKIIPGPPPISNDKGAGTIHHLSTVGAVTPFAPPPPTPPQYQGGAISNERYISLSPPPPPQITSTQPTGLFIGQPPAPFSIGSGPGPSSNDEMRFVRQEPIVLNPNTDTFIAPSAGALMSNPDAQILQGQGTPITADTDRSIGGGGNLTKPPRADEVSIEGKAPHILTCPCGSTKFGLDPADLPSQACKDCGGYTSIYTCLSCGKKSCSMAHSYET